MTRAPRKCRYDDCPEGHSVASDEEQVTCGSCRMDLGLPTINTLFDLAREVYGYNGEDGDRAVARIGKALFKGTECGISFGTVEAGVYVAGYAEGSDAECSVIELLYPFTPEEFWEATEEADREGCEAWDEANFDETAGTLDGP